MYRRIIVGIDGSQHAEHALRHAVGLARELGGGLHAVHVVNMNWLPVTPELGFDLGRATAARHAQGQALLDRAAEATQGGGAAVKTGLVETATPGQSPAVAFVEEGASWRADVVVLGMGGHRVVEQLLLGSMADGVARCTTIPLVLVPLRDTALKDTARLREGRAGT